MSAEQDQSGDTEMKFSGVFKSLAAVKKVLYSDKYVNLPEVQELLRIFNDHDAVDNKEVVERSQRKVFIVFEGIDASGKTTISHKLSKLINGRQMGTPPEPFLGLRDKFDAHELVLKRAYYGLGNYLIAKQVKQYFKEEPVIMDRFWHSTAAYTLAEMAVNNSNGIVPPEGDEVYEWPADLLKPDLVFFLTVSESKRLDRLMRRKGKTVTREELRLQDDKLLREALANVYLRMYNPPLVQLDADPTADEVFDELLKLLNKHLDIDFPAVGKKCRTENEEPQCDPRSILTTSAPQSNG